jgi:hypothetical protein
MKKYYVLLFCLTFSASNGVFAQWLHHQMISSQGASTTTSSGFIIKQTVGQQSVSGNSQGDIIVQQGFQQNYWQELLKTSNSAGIMITTYPNPFREVLNFRFSNFSGTSVQVSIFDSYGRSVFEKTAAVNDNLLTLEDMPILPSAQYLVRLSGTNLNYFTTTIKI